MAAAAVIKPATKPGVEEADAAPVHRIRITLTSKNVRNLEKGEWAWVCGGGGGGGERGRGQSETVRRGVLAAPRPRTLAHPAHCLPAWLQCAPT